MIGALLGSLALAAVTNAQDNPAEVPVPPPGAVKFDFELPKTPFAGSFATVMSADREKGTLEYVVTKPVYETKTRTKIVKETLPDGKVVEKEVTMAYTIAKSVPETRVMEAKDRVVTNTAGKELPLAEAMKRVEFKGRKVLFAPVGGIDPYYLPFLAKDLLIIKMPPDAFADEHIGPPPVAGDIPRALPPAPPIPPAPPSAPEK